MLNPKTDTYTYLLDRITTLFVYAAAGNLDGFEVAPDLTGDKRSILQRAGAFAAATPAAALPLLIVWLCGRAGLLKDSTLTYGVVASVIWACAALMAEFDPRYSDRIAVVQKLASNLPFLPKDKRE